MRTYDFAQVSLVIFSPHTTQHAAHRSCYAAEHRGAARLLRGSEESTCPERNGRDKQERRLIIDFRRKNFILELGQLYEGYLLQMASHRRHHYRRPHHLLHYLVHCSLPLLWRLLLLRMLLLLKVLRSMLRHVRLAQEEEISRRAVRSTTP